MRTITIVVGLCCGIAMPCNVGLCGELMLKKDGGDSLLYQYTGLLYISTWALEFNPPNDSKMMTEKEWKEGLRGNRMQAAVFAFMVFIERTHTKKGFQDDRIGRGFAKSTKELMLQVDWNEFEKYSEKFGPNLINEYFENYDQSGFRDDLRKFKKFIGDKSDKGTEKQTR